MDGLKYLLTITKREYSEDYLAFFRNHGIKTVLSEFCNGTATESTLSLLGLEKTEKVMLNTIVASDSVADIIKGLLVEMDISSAGNGIAVFLPIDSVGGASSLKTFIGEKTIEKKENVMNLNESKNVLIITIAPIQTTTNFNI